MTLWTKDRVSNIPLRVPVQKALNDGITLSHICRVLDETCEQEWIRQRNGQAGNADTTKLRRSLGLRVVSNGNMISTVRIDVAKGVCKAIGISYSDLYERKQDVVAIQHCPCGEEHFGDQILCQFCIEEQSEAA